VDALSRHDFAVRLAKAFALDVGLVRPVRSADLKLKARRPADSSLSSAKAKRHRVTIGSADEGIAAMKGQRALEDFVPPTRFKS
jgi:dTDP-4-dehydrorhamnose reductase